MRGLVSILSGLGSLRRSGAKSGIILVLYQYNEFTCRNYICTLIIGSGLAGLTLALNLASSRKVGLITKKALLDGASGWAQGGIAATLSEEDSPEAHIRDTLVAGAGLCNEAVTSYVVENGPQAIQWLIRQGVPFTRDHDNGTGYHLTREGGHSVRRVIHAADATGQAVQRTLIDQARTHPNITVLEHRRSRPYYGASCDPSGGRRGEEQPLPWRLCAG